MRACLNEREKLSLFGKQHIEICHESRFKLYDQANKRIRWMPRQLEAMKDVGACEKSRGGGNRPLIRECPNGETHLA